MNTSKAANKTFAIKVRKSEIGSFLESTCKAGMVCLYFIRLFVLSARWSIFLLPH